MSVSLIAVLFLIGFFGAFLSGMLGIGGAIINYPMLLYIPPLLGVGGFNAHEVSGMVAVQVFFSTLAGLTALRKEKWIHYRLVTFMGTAMLVGSFTGSYGGQFLSGHTINLVYALLATVAAVMMFVPKRGLPDLATQDVPFHRPLAVLSALIVGIASGIAGAGGSFILVPVMLVLLKIPIRMTIASSMAITFIASIGTVGGKLLAAHIPVLPTVILVIASLIAAPLGTAVSKKTNPRLLQAVLAALLIATTLKIWSDLLGS